MANTFELISSVTVGAGGASNIEFTSIPSTFTDLCLKLSIRTARSNDPGDEVFITFNSSTSGYSSRYLLGYGSGSPASGVGGSTAINRNWAATANATGNVFHNSEIYIPNYAGASNKSASIDFVTENNTTYVYTGMTAGLWSNSAAITSIKLAPEVGPTFLQYSSAYLYGVKSS